MISCLALLSKWLNIPIAIYLILERKLSLKPLFKNWYLFEKCTLILTFRKRKLFYMQYRQYIESLDEGFIKLHNSHTVEIKVLLHQISWADISIYCFVEWMEEAFRDETNSWFQRIAITWRWCNVGTSAQHLILIVPTENTFFKTIPRMHLFSVTVLPLPDSLNHIEARINVEHLARKIIWT